MWLFHLSPDLLADSPDRRDSHLIFRFRDPRRNLAAIRSFPGRVYHPGESRWTGAGTAGRDSRGEMRILNRYQATLQSDRECSLPMLWQPSLKRLTKSHDEHHEKAVLRW